MRKRDVERFRPIVKLAGQPLDRLLLVRLDANQTSGRDVVGIRPLLQSLTKPSNLSLQVRLLLPRASGRLDEFVLLPPKLLSQLLDLMLSLRGKLQRPLVETVRPALLL